MGHEMERSHGYSLDPAVEDEVVGQMCVEKLTALGEI